MSLVDLLKLGPAAAYWVGSQGVNSYCPFLHHEAWLVQCNIQPGSSGECDRVVHCR
jgi:hypothetical protein